MSHGVCMTAVLLTSLTIFYNLFNLKRYFEEIAFFLAFRACLASHAAPWEDFYWFMDEYCMLIFIFIAIVLYCLHVPLAS